ncbi:MAG TPA: NAD-dependent epimerase/dehydratase family protein [Puia sp.]|jgi:UDP-glucose 4-epimerase|nr:NAD-dependent epimerase/dehydratase family protein [Puia sp.]
MTTSLVTGGAGFIGSHVAKNCLRLGHHVIVLDDLSGGFQINVPDGAAFVQGSLEDEELLDDLFKRYRFDYIYHLAAYAAEGLSHFIRCYNYNTNLIGSAKLINKAIEHHVKCFVFTSSIAVYGRNQLPMREDMTPMPEDPYGIAKYAVELDLNSANLIFGLNSIIFRPHNVYGENQNIGDKYRNVIGIFMNQIMKKEEITIFGDGEQTRAFSYIGDVAPIIAKSVNFPAAYNKTFNIGASKPYSVNCLAHLIAQEFGTIASIRHEKPRIEAQHAFSDHVKAKSYFGEIGETSIQEGIRLMANWAKSVGAKSSKKFKKIEVMENLPEIWQTASD